MKEIWIKIIKQISIVILAVTVLWVPGYCETPKTVAIVPIEMNASQDLGYLQKGLFSMLSARLADPGKVSILDREQVENGIRKAQSDRAVQGPLNDSKARLIGNVLGVDYVLYGSLTLFGKSMSLDMFMVDVIGTKPTLSFSRQAPDPGAVITELDQIAAQINLKTFGRKPEQVLPKEIYAQQTPQPVPQQSLASPLSKFQYLFAGNGHINGVTCGDVDGDSRNDVVIIYDHDIEILKDNQAGKLVLFKRIEAGHYNDLVSVETLDLNQNGIEEIFVTRVHRESGLLRSMVLEFSNGQFKPVGKDLPWYIRASGSGETKTLYGQKSGKHGPYHGRNVFQIAWKDNRYARGDVISVPEGFSVLSMATGANIHASGRDEMVFTDQAGRLKLIDGSGQIIFASEAEFGGTRIYYTFQNKDNDLVAIDEDEEGVFFQPRNLVFDLDADGKTELIVIKNNEAANYMFDELRNFKSGTIEMLGWNEMGLSPDKAGKLIPGQITDIYVGDYDGDSKPELLVSFIKTRNNFSSKNSKSAVVAYDL